mgnify:CR=1 FL=1
MIDLEGNVKVSGYGISRNTIRDAPFVKYASGKSNPQTNLITDYVSTFMYTSVIRKHVKHF